MSTDLARCARIAVMLEGARASARRLFGDEYEKRVAPWHQFVRKFATSNSCGPIEVPAHLERVGAMPANPLLLFAAVVDVVEEGASTR